MRDNLLLTVAQIVAMFGVSEGAVRAWIAAGSLKPVLRRGAGRSGMMYFARGEVVAFLYARCPVCGSEFKKAVRKQRFCSTACRQVSARVKRGLP